MTAPAATEEETPPVGPGVVVDRRPCCQHCGKRVAKYLARPWSLRCPHCGRQASSR